MSGISKRIAELEEKYIKKGYKIQHTTDSYFLQRKPQKKGVKQRWGEKLGTYAYGGRYKGTVFAYKEE